MNKEQEIKLLKNIVKAQARMIMAYKTGIPKLPEWVFTTMYKAEIIYGPKLTKII